MKSKFLFNLKNKFLLAIMLFQCNKIIQANEHKLSATIPYVLSFQDNVEIPYNYVTLTARINAEISQKFDENNFSNVEIMTSLRNLIDSLKETACEIEWDYLAENFSKRISNKRPINKIANSVLELKKDQHLDCCDSEIFIRMVVKTEDIVNLKKIFDKNTDFVWKIEGLQVREIDKARQNLRNMLLKKAQIDAISAAEAIDYECLGFKQIVCNAQPANPVILQGLSFELNDEFFQNFLKNSSIFFPANSINICERLECVFVFKQKSMA